MPPFSSAYLITSEFQGQPFARAHFRTCKWPFVAASVGPDSFHGADEPARAADIEWVESFRETASGAKFLPHVTAGVGRIPPETLGSSALAPTVAFNFTASRVAACHLGRHCTCRSVLREWRLG